jgi:alpha-L-rhamnosidase
MACHNFFQCRLIILVMIYGLFFTGCAGEKQPVIDQLSVEYMQEPIGLEVNAPRLGWKMSGKEYGLKQSAYQVIVAKDPGDLESGSVLHWDSGKVYSGNQVNIIYQGEPLMAGERYHWKVRVWDQDDKISDYSDISFWEMGLFDGSYWTGDWISAVEPVDSLPPLLPAPFMRKEFSIPGNIVSARLYISGLGYYQAYLNGEKVGDHVLDPVKTRYDKRVKYVTYDITEHLDRGNNALGVVLGNGWYNQHTREAWDFDQAPWRGSPSLLCQVIITTDEGDKIVVKSDDTWKYSFGPIVFNGIHNGETYDARLELDDWNSAGYDDSEWFPVIRVPGPGGKLSSQIMPPMRIIDSIQPVNSWMVNDSVKMIDLGQNITGWAKISVSGPEGSKVTLRYGERIYDDGTLDQQELSRFIWTGDTQTGRYILKGEGIEEWHQIFAYHGFKYIEISFSSPEINLLDITGHVVHTDLEEKGYFSCSNDMFNRIHENLRWSFLGNYHGYPTDCPHREKMGWTGDALLVAESGLYNFDVVRAYLKWIDDFVDEQRPNGQLPGIIPTSGWGYTYGRGDNRERGYGPQWEGAFMEIPWQIYRFTGDTAIIEKYYPYFKKYIDYLSDHSRNYLLDFGIDDHKQLKNLTHGDYLSSAFYFRLADMLSDMAAITGRTDDQVEYSTLASGIKKSFNQKYYNTRTGKYLHGGQTPMALALYFGLTEDTEEFRVLEGLLKVIESGQGHIDAGVVGTKAVINSLLMYGAGRVLYEMTDKREFPGWGYWIEELGATTLYQNWDGSQSRNHIMFGSIGDYFYKGLAGINIDNNKPGFSNIIISPSLDNDITWVRAGHDSYYGMIKSAWEKDGNDIIFEITIPPNTTAEVHIPGNDNTSVTFEHGKKAKYEGFRAGSHLYTLLSGTYKIRARNIQ